MELTDKIVREKHLTTIGTHNLRYAEYEPSSDDASGQVEEKGKKKAHLDQILDKFNENQY